jgi:hypothetical protein
MNEQQLRDHLKERHCDTKLYDVKIGFTILESGEYSYEASFYLYDFTHKLCGYQKYNPDFPKVCNPRNSREQKYFTHMTSPSVFGIESLQKYEDCDTLFVVEGVFDACAITTHLQYPCIAVFSNNPKSMRSQLDFLKLYHRLVAVCDGDDAGKQLAKYTDTFVTCPSGKDASDLTKEELTELCKEFIC